MSDNPIGKTGISRRQMLMSGAAVVAAAGTVTGVAKEAAAQTASGDKPNILVIWGDDIGQSNISAYTRGLMGYQTPNITVWPAKV